MVVMFVARCFDFTQKHFNTDHRNGLGLAFVFLAVAMVSTISQLTYQWIERPYQNEFRELAARRFKTWNGHAN
jgi:peptidoglycan/LPS O-acetylase OafA/YrhL